MDRPYLLVDADRNEVRFLSLREAMQRMTADNPGGIAAVIMDLSKSEAVFRRRADDKQEWSMSDLQKVTGLPFRTLDSWIRDHHIIPCSIKPGCGKTGPTGARIFSRHDAKIAATVAAIRRQMMAPLPLLRRVAELLAEHEPAKVANASLN